MVTRMYSRYQQHSQRRVQLAQPTASDVRPVNPVSSSLSIGFKNERFLWDMIAPVSEQTEQSGTYFVYDREFWFRRQEGAERAAEGPYTRVGYGVSNQTFNAREIGFEKLLGEVTRNASQTPENLETQDIQFLTNLIQLELEKRVSGVLFITGVWGTSNTLTGSNQWSDFANSDPIADADTASNTIRQNTGATPNTMFVGKVGWDQLKNHPLVLEKYKYTQRAIMTPELVAAVLEVPEITVGDSVENTAGENLAFTGADIWTDNALFLVRNNPALGVANGSYTFMWDEKGNIPWAVEDYQADDLRSTVNRIFTHIDPQIVSAQHGYLFLDVAA